MGDVYQLANTATPRVHTADPDSAVEAALVARLGATAVVRARRRPRFQPSYALLAMDSNRSLGHALLAHERRTLGSTALDVAELALETDVPEAVEPLLAAAVNAAAGAELPFLVLRGAPARYAAYGLAPCALTTTVQLAAAGGEAGRLRPVALADADDLAALADAGAAWLRLAPRRTPPDWRWLLEAPQRWRALDDGRGRLVAFALLDGTSVVEAAAADAGAARALVGALVAENITTLALPLGHTVTRAALQLGGELIARAPRPDEPGELWGVVDLAAALATVADELARRLARSRYAGWCGSVRLEGVAGAASLLCNANGVVVQTVGPVDVMVGGLGLAAASQLVLGYRQAADLRATGELRCADVDLGLLDTLFSADG